MTFYSTSSQRRPGGKDEPEDLRQLRREHGGSLATLKELFPDWTEEDLLYAIQDAGGDVNLATLRISEGHATQWGEVKGKKKTQKPKTTTSSQRGGFADRGSRGRGDGFRGGRGGSTRGTSRQTGDRQGRSTKVDDPYPALNGSTYVEKIDISTRSSSAWGASSSAANETSDSWSTPQEVTTFDETVAESEITTTTATDSWDTPEPSTVVADSNDTSTTSTADSWGSTSTTPARKLNTSTIPAGSKMSWAKIVKPEPAPQPVPQPAPVAPSKSIPATTPTPASAQEHTSAPPVEEKPAEVIPEPIVETAPEPTPVVEEAPVEEVPEPEIAEPAPEKQDEETAPEQASEPEPEPEPVPEPVKAPAPTPAASVATNATPVGPPGLKHKPAPQPRRLNQDAAVVMPIGSTALQSVGLKFGSFSLNDEPEPEPEPAETEPETQTEQTSHELASNSPS
ncbi:hypothetical protein BGZ80_006805, partial [Entomortierella chlamydospora]